MLLFSYINSQYSHTSLMCIVKQSISLRPTVQIQYSRASHRIPETMQDRTKLAIDLQWEVKYVLLFGNQVNDLR